ncbi:beta-lactamase family protein [candidate division KSB1 bacterium]|nr:beta-lactamase family protein [candidate division KSB1 bacterium]
MFRAIYRLLAMAFCLFTIALASGQGLPNSPPEEVGLSSERLRRINAVMQSYIDERKLAWLVTLVARRGKIAHFEKFGSTEIEKAKRMQFDTIFQIASMTKPIITAAAMMLYEEGHFQLGDPVSQFIPAFKQLKVATSFENGISQLAEQEREITVLDLLTHTSGIGSAAENTPIGQAYLKAEWGHPDDTFDDMIKKLIAIPLLHQPGASWSYGNSTDVLGYFVETVSGMPLDRFLHERLFQPLGMHDTGFHVPTGKQERLAAIYRLDKNNRLQLVEKPADSRLFAGKGQKRFLSGNGGLVSTPSDYARFCQMLLNQGELDGVRIKETMFGILMAQFIPFTQYPIARQFTVLAYQAIID